MPSSNLSLSHSERGGAYFLRQILLRIFLVCFANSGQSYFLVAGTSHKHKSILLVSQDPSSEIMLRSVDSRTSHIFWSEKRDPDKRWVENMLLSYEIIMFETSDPLSMFTASKQSLSGKVAKLMYISQCTHYILSEHISSEANITKCGPKLFLARQLDMIIAPSTETSDALSLLNVKSMFYPNWTLRKINYKGDFTKLFQQNLMNPFYSHECKAGGIFVSYGSRGGKKARDMGKIRSILRLTRNRGTTAVLCSRLKPNSNSCTNFNICEQCSPKRYFELLKCMRILLLPLNPRGHVQSQLKTESGRGLRTIISAMEQKVHIITADAPYTRDYLLNYSCATLLPQYSSAREYFKHIKSTLRKVHKEVPCDLNYYPHDSSAETALPKLLDIVTAL